MTIPAGKPELAPCPTCGKEVHRQLMRQHGEVFYYWFSHDAPCKKPCLQGGVHGSIYKAGVYHKAGCKECSDARVAELCKQAER